MFHLQSQHIRNLPKYEIHIYFKKSHTVKKFPNITVNECVSFYLSPVSGTLYYEEYIMIIPSHCSSKYFTIQF